MPLSVVISVAVSGRRGKMGICSPVRQKGGELARRFFIRGRHHPASVISRSSSILDHCWYVFSGNYRKSFRSYTRQESETVSRCCEQGDSVISLLPVTLREDRRIYSRCIKQRRKQNWDCIQNCIVSASQPASRASKARRSAYIREDYNRVIVCWKLDLVGWI